MRELIPLILGPQKLGLLIKKINNVPLKAIEYAEVIRRYVDLMNKGEVPEPESLARVS